MKKFIVSVMIVSILLPLCGCTTQEEPAYLYVDGEGYDYIILNMDFSQYKTDDCRGAWRIDFESPEEMIRDLTTGSLTEDELYELSRMRKDEQGRVIIPDLDNLYRCMHPELTELRKVRLEEGAEYGYYYEDISFWFYPKEMFEKLAYSSFYYWVTEETVEAMRTRYVKKQKKGEDFYFHYRYENDAWIAYIKENYDASGEEIGALDSLNIYLENEAGVYIRMYVSLLESSEGLSAIHWTEHFAVEKLQTP